jgi:hypothetical protein
MAEIWTRAEVEIAVADYFAMLEDEIKGKAYSKAAHWKKLQPRLKNRTSVDRKHQNISAVLIKLGYPYIAGYKPLWNHQALIRDIVVDRVERDAALAALISRKVSSPVTTQPSVEKVKLVPPPKRSSKDPVVSPQLAVVRKDFLEIEARNRALGLAGEHFVIEMEKKRLTDSGYRELAKRVEHVAETKGDLLGYDVLSFEASGCERLIEVKTTRFGEMIPFYVSPNEIKVSERNAAIYQLFRLFSFHETPGLFVLHGSLKSSCRLEPVRFAAFRF